jgi:hypothetical protein
MANQGFGHFLADLLVAPAKLIKSFNRFFTTLGGLNGQHRTTR